MTPERAEAVLRAVVLSLGTFVEELEVIETLRPGTATHLLATMRQSRISLIHMLQHGDGPGRVE